jgi:hypothetical protein
VTPNQALHLTGAAILVSRDTKLLQRPRQVSLVVGRSKHAEGSAVRHAVQNDVVN